MSSLWWLIYIEVLLFALLTYLFTQANKAADPVYQSGISSLWAYFLIKKHQ